jgi:putative flippase GtrA
LLQSDQLFVDRIEPNRTMRGFSRGKSVDLHALARFLAGGVASTVVTLGTTAALHEMAGIPEVIAAAVGLAASLLVNFAVLRFFVFRGTELPLVRQAMMFLGSSGVFRGLEYSGFFVLHLVGVHYLVGLVLVLGSSFVVKFFVYERLVFSRKPGVRSP